MAENINFDEIEGNEDFNEHFDASLNIQEETKQDQIKKPSSAFAIFIQEMRSQIQQDMKA
jgi:hypothetical protein